MKSSAFSYYLKSIVTLNAGVRNRSVLLKLLFDLPLDRPYQVDLRDGTHFLALTLMDLWVLKETILDRTYEKVGVPLQMGWTVVDIGAALGDFAIWAALQMSTGRVIAVEPFPTSVELLQENLHLNLLDNVSLCECAVASQNGSSHLNLATGEAAQHSTAGAGDTSSRIEVQTVTLADLFDTNNIQVCDYLKMDCEGAEYDILMNAPADLLARITRICMEVHDGVTHYSRVDLQQFLEANGYGVRITPNPVHENLAYLYAERYSNP